MTKTRTEIVRGTRDWAWRLDWEPTAASVGVAMLAGECGIGHHGHAGMLTACQLCVLPGEPSLTLRFRAATAMVFTTPELDTVALPRGVAVAIDPTSADVLDTVCIDRACRPAHRDAALAFVCHHVAAGAAAPETEPPAADRAAAYLKAHLDEAVTLDALARHCRCAKSTLGFGFRARHGKSPMRYLADLRATHARRCLEQTEMAIGEIAHAVGYTDVATFSHFFRKHAGLSPSDVRRNARWVL